MSMTKSLYCQRARMSSFTNLFAPLKLKLAVALASCAPQAQQTDLNEINKQFEKNRQAGRYSEAKPLYRLALAIREKLIDADHPDVAHTLNNLANVYRSQSKYADATQLHERALAIREKALGADHPDVAHTLHNLALVYQYQSKY